MSRDRKSTPDRHQETRIVWAEFCQAVEMALAEEDGVNFVSVQRGIDYYAEVKHFEIALIEKALHCSGGSQIRAARMLGIDSTTLNKKIKAYKIVPGKKPVG